MNPALIVNTDSQGVSRITLNRPDIHNAFDDKLIVMLDETLSQLESLQATRILVLDAAGRSFSAGADLNWMKRSASYSEQENKRDALALAHMLHKLNTFPQPTVAVVQGAALGGGVGLVACCDIAIAAERASFTLSEVRLGLIPATISPFVIDAIGQRAARRYFLTAERFDSLVARELGLIHQRVPDDQLQDQVEKTLDTLLQSGPEAQQQAKELIRSVSGRVHDDNLLDETAMRIANVRASAEGREGIGAFLEKRQPKWYQTNPDEQPKS